MTDLELLFLVLGIIYLWECCWWAKRGAFGFRTWLGKRWSATEPSRSLGTQSAGLVLAVPLPPLGTLVTSQVLPLALSPDAVLAPAGPDAGLRIGGAQEGNLVSFAEMTRVETRAKTVYINGKPFLKSASPGVAAYLAGVIDRVRATKSSERKAVLEREMARRFDSEAIRRRWAECETQLRGLRFSTNLLFFYLFALAPLMLWRVGLIRAWPWLLIGLLICTVTIATHYYRAHKQLYPEGEDERFTHFIILLLSPASAVRAQDLLTRPILECFHPVAVAKIFCPAHTFETLAKRFLRQVTYPGSTGSSGQDQFEAEAEQYDRELKKRVLEGFLKANGLSAKELLRPPAPTDPSCVSYCPRCLAQFTKERGQCSDCGGVELISFSRKIAADVV
jgi:hypothetical protein